MEHNPSDITALINLALAEDIGPGDITSLASLEPAPAIAQVVAKSHGILSGVEPFTQVFATVDSANKLEFIKADSDKFEPGDVIAKVDGFNQTILSSERVALNFLGHLSGIATLTSQFVDAVKGTTAKILDTRKTTPGWRFLEKQAVAHGGSHNHRIGLYDMVLIKDNHIASAGSITRAVELTRDFMTTPDYRLRFSSLVEKMLIEVEVCSEKQLREAITVGVDRLLLDNQSTESLAHLVKVARELSPELELEASGNVTLDNVREVAETGVDYISIGALTHSVPVSDFSMKFLPVA